MIGEHLHDYLGVVALGRSLVLSSTTRRMNHLEIRALRAIFDAASTSVVAGFGSDA